MDKDNCKCQHDYTCGDPNVPDLRLSEAYIKDQLYENLLPVSVGFHEGTIFKDLVRPWGGKSCKKRS